MSPFKAETSSLDDAAIRRFYRSLGARVRAARQHAGLTQHDLSEHLGITRTSVANLEAGRQRVPIYVLALILDICSIPATELLVGPSMWEESDLFFNLDGPLADETDSTREFVAAALHALEYPGTAK